MIGIFSFITRLFGGGLADQLRRAYEAKLNAQTNAERLAAEVSISQLQARQASLVAGGMLSSLMQAGFAAPFMIYNMKLILWDKVLGWGTTDPLSEHLYTVEGIVISFYFAGTIIRGILR